VQGLLVDKSYSFIYRMCLVMLLGVYTPCHRQIGHCVVCLFHGVEKIHHDVI